MLPALPWNTFPRWFLVSMLLMLFVGMEGVQRSLIVHEVVRLELSDVPREQDLQEFLILLRQSPEIRRVTYHTREQQVAQSALLLPQTTIDAAAFRDTLLVRVAHGEGYRFLLRLIGGHTVWGNLLEPRGLHSLLEQERRVQSTLSLLASLRWGLLGTVVGMMLLLGLEAFRHSRQLSGPLEENAPLALLLGERLPAIGMPVLRRTLAAYSMGMFGCLFIVLLAGVSLATFRVSVLPLLPLATWWIPGLFLLLFLAVGCMGSIGGVLSWRKG